MTLACVAIDQIENEDDGFNEAFLPPEVLEQLIAAPRVNFKRAKGLCLECRTPKNEKRSLAHFCSTPCRTTYHNRAKVRGAAIIHQAIVWRRFRRKGDFTKLVKLIDDFAREDKAAGRTHYPPPPLAASVRVVGQNIQGRARRR